MKSARKIRDHKGVLNSRHLFVRDRKLGSGIRMGHDDEAARDAMVRVGLSFVVVEELSNLTELVYGSFFPVPQSG